MKNNFWTFSDEQKSMFVAQTSERVGLPPQAVEKDWWVTMTLNETGICHGNSRSGW